MRIPFACLVAVTWLVLSATASALPPGFESCQPRGAAQGFKYGETQIYNGCSRPSGAEEYGYVFLQFTPPEGIGMQGVVTDRQRRRFWQRVRRFFAPNTSAGTMVVSLTLIEGTREIPLDIIPLATFRVDEQNGLTVRNEMQTASNDIGYRFRVTSETRVRARFLIQYTSETNPNIVQSIQDVSDIAGGFGYLPSATFTAALEPLRALEARIFQQGNYDDGSLRTSNFAFTVGGDSAVEHRLRVVEDAALTGSVFIAIRRDLSVFPVPAPRREVVANQINFHLDAWGETQVGPIVNGLISATPLSAHLASKMGPSYGLLSTSNEGQFQVACESLRLATQDNALRLATQDRVLAMWATLAPLQNTRLESIREQPCMESLLGDFQTFGLSMPRARARLPAAYEQLLTSSNEQAQRGREAAAAADAVRIAALNFANAARTPSPPNGEIVRELTLRSYAGQPFNAMTTFTGVLTNRDENGVAGDVYAGEFRLAGEIPVYHGHGYYRFVNSPDAAGRIDYSGDLRDNYFSGLGQMTYADGRSYEGQFANDLPNGFGAMSLPDGRTQYGSFREGVITRGVEETSDGRQRSGVFVNGALPAAVAGN